MKVKIYCPAKSAMQSPRVVNKWLIEPIEEKNCHSINPLTGYISVDDTSLQIRLSFNSKQEAIEYANSKNWQYQLSEPNFVALKKKSYASNFV